MDLLSYLTEYIDYSTFEFLFFPCTVSVSFFFNKLAFDSFFHGRGCSEMPKGPLLAILLQLDSSVPLGHSEACQLLDLTVKQLVRDTACLLREPQMSTSAGLFL